MKSKILRGLAAFGLACTVVAACTPGAETANRSGIEPALVSDEDLLREAGYSEAITLRVPVDLSLLRGESRNDEIERRMLFLWSNGDLALSPNPDAAPWVRLTAERGAILGSEYESPPIARREMVGRSAQTTWEEHGRSYFAETISYNIRFDERLQGLAGEQIGPIDLRVVAFNDPRVGAWRLSEANFSAEPRVITDLVDNGAQSLNAFQQARATAMEQAFEIIAQRLADQGVIARTADPDVLTSRSANLAFYIGFGQSADVAQTPLRALPQQAASMCAARPSAAGYGAWRLPTLNEMDAVTTPHRIATGTRVLLDAPDGRVWRHFAAVQYPNSLIVPSSEPPPYPAYPATGYFFSHDRSVRASRGGDMALDVRNRPAIICVASATGR